MPAVLEPEPHAYELLGELRETRAALADQFPGARFLAFWDLDGTILHGDCAEGLTERGRAVYPGLVELAIARGLSHDYPADDGVVACRDDLHVLQKRIGAWLAKPFLAQIFVGAEERVLTELAGAHFAKTLAPHCFAASRRIFDGLAAEGVEQHVLSDAPEFFVRGAAATLGLPPEQLHGIRVRMAAGHLTRELIYPVTFATGKRTRLLEIVRGLKPENPARRVFVLAAFGNSHVADGAFLAQVARETLPAGQPVAMMINGGIAPSEYRRLFRSVRQTRIMSET
jgi:phosphoserine phosphatase